MYFEKVDYVKIKSNKSNASLTYMTNYQCFETLAMAGDSDKSETIRMYFILTPTHYNTFLFETIFFKSNYVNVELCQIIITHIITLYFVLNPNWHNYTFYKSILIKFI
jgi:hypothetical protein